MFSFCFFRARDGVGEGEKFPSVSLSRLVSPSDFLQLHSLTCVHRVFTCLRCIISETKKQHITIINYINNSPFNQLRTTSSIATQARNLSRRGKNCLVSQLTHIQIISYSSELSFISLALCICTSDVSQNTPERPWSSWKTDKLTIPDGSEWEKKRPPLLSLSNWSRCIHKTHN